MKLKPFSIISFFICTSKLTRKEWFVVTSEIPNIQLKWHSFTLAKKGQEKLGLSLLDYETWLIKVATMYERP